MRKARAMTAASQSGAPSGLPNKRVGQSLSAAETDAVRQMFDRIAPRYDLLNHLLSIGHDILWRQTALAAGGLGPSSSVVDIACGTGDFAIEALLSAPTGTVTGVDFSPKMLLRAKEKAKARGIDQRLELLHGDALALPFPDHRYDLAVSGFAMRNLADVRLAIAEMARVVRPSGRVVILEIGRPT